VPATACRLAYDPGCATSSARSATRVCSITSEFHAPRPSVGFGAARGPSPLPSQTPRGNPGFSPERVLASRRDGHQVARRNAHLPARGHRQFQPAILAWKLALHLEPNTTCQLLAEAGKHLPAGSDASSVVADSGVENVNQEVNAWFDAGPLRRVLAQVEVSFSNSLIEAWWRSLKHGWLYLHQPDTLAALEKLIGFYVEQHNSVVPHAAFAGQTPDEMYFGRGDHVPGEVAACHAHARAARLKSDRGLSCGVCRPSVHDTPGLPDPPGSSGVLQMRDEMSGMS
jgi:putative transposase